MHDLWTLQDPSVTDFDVLGAGLDFFQDTQLPQLSHQGFSRTSSCPLTQNMSLRANENECLSGAQGPFGTMQTALPTNMAPFAGRPDNPFQLRSSLPLSPGEVVSTPPNTDSMPTTAGPSTAHTSDTAVSLGKQSLDETEGYSAQYFGLSGEMDPYLLRHFHFADADTTKKFFKVHYRQVSPESPNDIPVHFRLTAHELANPLVSETSIRPLSPRPEPLEALVPVQVGVRLVGL